MEAREDPRETSRPAPGGSKSLEIARNLSTFDVGGFRNVPILGRRPAHGPPAHRPAGPPARRVVYLTTHRSSRARIDRASPPVSLTLVYIS